MYPIDNTIITGEFIVIFVHEHSIFMSFVQFSFLHGRAKRQSIFHSDMIEVSATGAVGTRRLGGGGGDGGGASLSGFGRSP